MKIKFYDNIDENLLKFAVIISKYKGKWVFCKHKERTTYEIPGGHKEAGESIYKAAERELAEETGASHFDIKPVCIYSVTGKNRVNSTGEETFGMLFFAEITDFSDVIDSEIEYIKLFDDLPEEWTYPKIQPFLIEEYIKRTRQN